MAEVKFICLEDVELRFGAERMEQLLNDDGTGTPEPLIVEAMLDDANSDVISRLLNKGYSLEVLKALRPDPKLKRLAAGIFMGYAGALLTQWLNANGDGPYEGLRRRAREELAKHATGELRLSLEPKKGSNTQVGGKLSKQPDPNFIFAPTRDRPQGAGGF